MSILDYNTYAPSDRFKELAQTDLAKDMWTVVADESNINKMIEAINNNAAPVTALDDELHEKFTARIEESTEDTEELKVLCMNMMKQILEKRGYSHSACAMLFTGKFVKSAGMFQKNS